MTDNTDSIVTAISNAKVLAVAERVVREFQLVAEKVAAHHGAPATYPMPSGSTATEHLMAGRFAALSTAQQKNAADRVAANLKDAPGRTKKLHDLAKVDLHSSASAESQVKGLPFPTKLKFPADDLHEATQPTAATESAAAAPPPLRKLELRIHRITCIEDTGAPEAGKVEIHLGGTATDESGDTDKISSFKVRSFRSGDIQSYAPPQRLVWFSLTEGPVTFPRSYFVTLVLAKADWGGLADFVDSLLERVRERVTAALAAAVGGALGSPGGPIGVLIGIAVGAALVEIFALLKSLWDDDIFKPFTVRTTISSASGRWAGRTDSPERTVTYAGHGGRYQLVYDWKMFN